MDENEIYEELAELKESFDRIFEYLPANEATDVEQQQKEIAQQEIPKSNMNQSQQQQPQSQKQNQQKEKFHAQKPWQTITSKHRSKPADAKIRPGFEGPKIIRTKRQTK